MLTGDDIVPVLDQMRYKVGDKIALPNGMIGCIIYINEMLRYYHVEIPNATTWGSWFTDVSEREII